MIISRRALLGSVPATAAAMLLPATGARAARTLKISHQFPGGTLEEGDFRDRLCRRFAVEIAKRTNGELLGEVYAGSSLMKTNAQFSAIRKGALDLTLLPLPYAGGEVPETNITLMPGLISTYEQSRAWKTAEVGKMLANVLADKGVMVITWIWQAGGVASRERPLVAPADVRGMKVRGGSREMDLALQAAGAAVLSLPSNELYAAMQTGACDAVITSSTSLVSFRLEEVAKHFTSPRNKAYWFMMEPLLMSRSAFESLPKDQQDVIMAVGAELEQFAFDAAKADDQSAVDVYQKAGAKIYDLDEPTVEKWRDLARETAWKDFADKKATNKRLLDLALQVS
jgi:TRAP-type C4-dicarboxylate transport system substrate-binding protein